MDWQSWRRFSVGKWEMVKLGEIGKFAPKSKIKAGEGKKEGKYKFFTSSNEQSKFLNDFTYDFSALVFGTGGNASVHYSDTPFSTSTDCLVYFLEDSHINLKYIFYYLFGNIHLLEEGFKGAGLKHISKKYIENDVLVPITTFEGQEKIVKLLDISSAALEKRKAQIDKLDLLIKSQFIEMFGDPVTNPMEWEENTLRNECEIVTGNTPPRSNIENYGNYIEWIKSDNINTPFMYLTSAAEMLSEKGFKIGRSVEANSILMTCIAGSISCIGNVAVTDRKVAFNQQINAIIPNQNNVLYMYYLLLLAKPYIQSTVNMSLKGILSKGKLQELKFPFPPISLQNQFAAFVQQVEAKINLLRKSLDKLELNHKSLMQKTFRGEIF